MKVIVIANIETQKEFENKTLAEGVEVHFETAIDQQTKGDVYFFLLPESELHTSMKMLSALNKPVFVNAVVTTLKNLPFNFFRINAWKGFLERNIVEIAAAKETQEEVAEIMRKLQWRYQFVPDVPGMVSARTIAMIINEAYFALGDEVSTKEDIDTAMKLGTNYPFGPFEWAEKIGLKNIADLLSKLSESETRYQLSPALRKEISI